MLRPCLGQRGRSQRHVTRAGRRRVHEGAQFLIAATHLGQHNRVPGRGPPVGRHIIRAGPTAQSQFRAQIEARDLHGSLLCSSSCRRTLGRSLFPSVTRAIYGTFRQQTRADLSKISEALPYPVEDRHVRRTPYHRHELCARQLRRAFDGQSKNPVRSWAQPYRSSRIDQPPVRPIPPSIPPKAPNERPFAPL